MDDVRYKPKEWQEMKEGIDKVTKEAIPKLKDINEMLGDIEGKIRELDSDRSIQFEHRNKEKELNELHDDYNQLGNFCNNVGDVVKRHFDKPFLEDMDKFAGKIRDLSIKNYKTENRIGSTTTITTPAAHRYGQVQTTTTKKDEITVEDIFKDSVAFDEVLQAQYKEIKMQNPDLELNYEQYREFVPSMRGFEYETIAEGQQKLEFWRDLTIAGALIILTITVPPLGIAASVAFGGLELKSAIEGKDWGTGRELNTTERVGRGAFGALDMIPLVGPAAKSFRAMDSFISMSRLSKVQGGEVKFNPSKVENVVQSMRNSKNYLFGKLRLKTLEIEKYGNNKMYDAAEKIARKIDENAPKVPIFQTNLDGTLGRMSTNLEEKARLNRIDSNRKIQNEINSVRASMAEMRVTGGINGTDSASVEGYNRIKRFREIAGLKPYAIDSGDTVASVTVNNNTYFGVNSTITKESHKATRELRQKWLKEVQWVPPKKNNPKHLGHAQSLTHGEAHALIRAYEKQGGLPKQVTMYVDRKTCNICRGELPALLKRLGIDELKVFSGGNTKPIIIKATK